MSNKRMSEVQDMAKQFDFNDLPYYFTISNLASINYSRFKDLLIIYSEIKNGNISIEKAEDDQEQFKLDLYLITRRKPRYKKENQLNIITNVKNLYVPRQRVIDLFNDYGKLDLKLCLRQNKEQDLKY